VHDFLIFRVVVPRLLATLVTLDSHDFIVLLALLGIPRVVPLAFVKVAVAIALLVMVALGEAVVFLILLVSPHDIISHSSTTVVGRLRPKSWYMLFEKRPFRKQRMTSSSVMLAMVVRISKCRISRSRSSLASPGIGRGECPP
jgi:hypothetical protein